MLEICSSISIDDFTKMTLLVGAVINLASALGRALVTFNQAKKEFGTN